MGYQWALGIHLIIPSILLMSKVCVCLGAQNMTTGCLEQEGLALLKFKNSIKYDFKMLSSWTGKDCCQWEGVGCDGATGNVVSLHLRGNYRGYFYSYDEKEYYLVGANVNSSLAELRHLKYLDLSGNDFQGSRFPEFIGSFKQLSYLNLSNAGFSGNIPHHIGNLSNLKLLDLSSSSFIFQMLMPDDMAWASGLSSLEFLDLSGMDLSQVTKFDMLFYTIPSLRELSLRGCRLSNANLGPHLNASKILPNIKHLDLSSNFFEGQLPFFFQNMTSLEFLDLSSFTPSVAWNVVNLLNGIPSLSELHLSRCGLNKTHLSPTRYNFSARSNIQHLDLSENSIEGRFPSFFTNLSSLKVLDLSQNSLDSSFPFMPNLLKLDLSYNNFNNTDLVGIWRQCLLKELRLSGNYFGEEMIGPSTNISECPQYNLEMLYLDGNQLNSSIPESFGRLTNLRVLHLMSNRFTGPIPEALGRLRLLEVLNLAYNQLTGPIPKFLGKLTKLDLSHNRLNGSLPESLGRLTGLRYLRLHSNQLTGSIPASVGQLASLQVFIAASNLLNGAVSVSLGGLTKLSFLDVSNNSLEGVVSEAHFANLSMLKYLDTSSNNKLTFKVSHEWLPPFQLRTVRLGACRILDGFPQWLRNQRMLNELVLSNASISGPLPTWLRKMPIIPVLDLSHNKLSGPLTNLPFGDPFNGSGDEYSGSLLLQGNLFNGSIPKSLCGRTKLTLLDVSSNRLSGNIPHCIGNLKEMMMLILGSNGLSGVLPRSLGNISSLAWLQLNDNEFKGELIQELGNLQFLRVLDLGNNKFFGSIPKWIGENLTTLMVLRLHQNNFTGTIPQSLCKSSFLQILDVAYNSLTGPIPHCIGELGGMIEAGRLDIRNGSSGSDENVIQVIKGRDLPYTKTLDLVFNMDLSSNKLVGEIPQELTALTLLVGLNLSHNHLSGRIPDKIGSMKSLNSLDLSENELTGMIPPSMAALNFLSHLNLSHNHLSGQVPTGNQLQTLTDPSAYAGNRDLCGAPLSKNCSNHEAPTTTKDKDKEADEPNVWFYLGILSGSATGFWAVIAVLVFNKRWRQKLFVFAEAAMEKLLLAVAMQVSKIKKPREVA